MKREIISIPDAAILAGIKPRWFTWLMSVVLLLSTTARAELFVANFSGNRIHRYSETNGAAIGTGIFVAAGSGGLNRFAGGLYLESPLAIGPYESRNTLVESNVIELTDPRAINYFLGERPTAFNNVSPSGTRIPLYHTIAPGGSYERDITVDDRIVAGIEEAVVCSML